MPNLSFKIPFKKNSGLVISSQELLDQYFYGVKLKEPGGSTFPNHVIEQYILSAQQELEKYLGIKLLRQEVEEDKDYFRSDWQKWGYIRTTYPVVEAIALDGYVGTIRQINYHKEWLSSRKTSDDELYHRHIYLVPNQNSPRVAGAIVYGGIEPHLGFTRNPTLPNYWRMKYITGFCNVPRDLLNFIGKLAAINIFHIMGDLILGAGIASQSISIDGLSQSISTTSSATNAGYGSRITGYLQDLKTSLPRVENYYKGITVSGF